MFVRFSNILFQASWNFTSSKLMDHITEYHFLSSSCMLDSPWGLEPRDMSPQFRLSLLKRWHLENLHSAPYHQPIDKSVDIQPHRFNVPVFFIATLLFRGLWQAETWLLRLRTILFIYGPMLTLRILFDIAWCSKVKSSFCCLLYLK